MDDVLSSLPKLVAEALQEDIGAGDVTGQALIDEKTHATGKFVPREEGVVAGLPCVQEVYRQLDPAVRVELHVRDGDRARIGAALVTVAGPARKLLEGERLALNFLGRLSGIATLTHRFVDNVSGTGAKILDTRKTTPLLRKLEKYAVAVGGGENHRQGLYDQVLIKDNHLAVLGGRRSDRSEEIVRAITVARARFDGVVAVEVDRVEEVPVAALAGADIILLDNFTVEQIAAAVRLIAGSCAKDASRPLLEASGGVTLDNVRAVAQAGADRISVGALTHSAQSLDIGLDFDVHP